jgi:hypothetical protein
MMTEVQHVRLVVFSCENDAYLTQVRQLVPIDVMFASVEIVHEVDRARFKSSSCGS